MGTMEAAGILCLFLLLISAVTPRLLGFLQGTCLGNYLAPPKAAYSQLLTDIRVSMGPHMPFMLQILQGLRLRLDFN